MTRSTDRLHRHDRGLLWCWGSPCRNEQQHLLPADCRPGSIRRDVNETTKRKRLASSAGEFTEARRCWPHRA